MFFIYHRHKISIITMLHAIFRHTKQNIWFRCYALFKHIHMYLLEYIYHIIVNLKSLQSSFKIQSVTNVYSYCITHTATNRKIKYNRKKKSFWKTQRTTGTRATQHRLNDALYCEVNILKIIIFWPTLCKYE